MKVIEPSVEIITPIDYDAMMRHIEQCGRTCYKSEHKITEGSAERFIRNIIKRGHESVLEHASFTVRWTVDRSISHQIVRHRIASYSQESQRYCVAGDMMLKTANPHNNISMDSENHNFVANGVIVHNCNYAKDDFGRDVTFIRPVQMTDDTPAFAIWKTVMQKCECAYLDLLTLGCSPQEARSVLPNSTKTELVMTANIREWRHFLKLRTSEGADPNMRHIASQLLHVCKFAMPALFYDIGTDGDGID